MKDLDEKTLNKIYAFDGVITETLKTFFKLYKFKVPPQAEIEKLTEIIRDMMLSIIDEDEIFYLDDYCKNAIFYASFYVHSVVLFSKGCEAVNEFYDVDYNLELSEELPPKVMEKAANILIQALDDYYFDVVEFINAGTLKAENFNSLVKFILGDCMDLWAEDEINAQELFLLLFQEKSYVFAKFLATYLAIVNGEPVRVKGNATKSTEEKILDWVFSRGN